MNSNTYIKNEIRASTDEFCYADEIFGYASDEIKSTHRHSDFIRLQGGFRRQRRFHPPEKVDLVEKPTSRNLSVFLVGEGGFEPPKALPADLQSVPFGHSGIPPYSFVIGGAGGRTRTPDLLITNQLLYRLSYTSIGPA